MIGNLNNRLNDKRTLMPGVVGIISIALLNGWFIALSTQAAVIAAVITGSLGLMLTAAYFIYTSNEKQEAHIYWY